MIPKMYMPFIAPANPKLQKLEKRILFMRAFLWSPALIRSSCSVLDSAAKDLMTMRLDILSCMKILTAPSFSWTFLWSFFMFFRKANVRIHNMIPRGIIMSANRMSSTVIMMSADSILTAMPAKPGIISV